MRADKFYATINFLLYLLLAFACPHSLHASNAVNNTPYDTIPASYFPPISTFENVDTNRIVVAYIGGEFLDEGNYSSTLSFLNDVKYFYNVVREGYHIPKKNINILFGTGVEGSMEILTDGQIEPLSLDLDNDSINDIIGGITTNRVEDLFDSIACCIRPDQHLLLVFDLHGEKAEGGLPKRMHLLDGDLSIESLASKLNSIHCASQCIILNSCFSGTFIKSLKKSGRIILTSANNTQSDGSPEQYNYFIHRWTNAINGLQSMTYGSPDKNEDVYISMLESFNYSSTADIGYLEPYSKTDHPDPAEPQYNSMPAELGANWAINHLPQLSGDLHIRDNEDDWGQSFGNDSIPLSWQSPDIWLRNSNDGLTNRQSEALKLSANDSIYVYVRVNNNGYNYYDGNERYLHLHWKLPSLHNQHSSWLEHEEIIPITCPIDTLSSEIICKGLRLPTEVKNIAIANNGNLNLDILARINDDGTMAGAEYETQFPFEESTPLDIINNPKLAGLSIVPNASVNGTATLHTSISLKTGESSLSLRAMNGVTSKFTFTYTINNTTYTQTANDDSDIVISGLQSNIEYPLTITCSANVPRSQAAKTFLLPIGLVCNDSIMGGVTFQMSVNGRGGLEPGIGDSGEYGDGGIDNGGEIGGPIYGGRTLSMTNVNEPVCCEWSDSQGNILGHNETLAIPLNASGNYTLSVQTLDDDIRASVTKQIEPISYFKNITISSGESVVELRSPAPAGTKLSLRSISSEAGQSVNRPEGTRLKTINTTNFPSGIYLLSLNVNNQLLETTKISL